MLTKSKVTTDENNNQVTELISTYTYDTLNRLVSITEGNVIREYTYTNTNKLMRIESFYADTSNPIDYTNYMWDGDNIIFTEYYSNESGEEVFTTDYYVRGLDLVSKINISGANDTHYYYIQNGRGDVSRMMDASGNIVNSYTYDPYGKILEQTEGTYNPFKYAGELQNLPDNLIYLRNRIYDPKIGRFLTEDPIKDGTNWYVYCNNNPVNYWDPLGLEDIYIFYGAPHGENGGFESRANKEKSYWEKQGKSVYIDEITSEEEFEQAWGNMSNDNGTNTIEVVSLYFHSNPTNLIIDYTKNEYITANESGKTTSGISATRIQDLEKKNIGTIYLYACNSAHQDVEENLAKTFFVNQYVSNVYGWDGSMRWSIFKGTPVLANNQDYFYSWLSKGLKRKPKGLVKYSVTRYSGRTRLRITIVGEWKNK